MAWEPNGGLGDGALLVQEGKEALQDPEACGHRARGQRVTERGLDPGIDIRGGRLRQVVTEEAQRASGMRTAKLLRARMVPSCIAGP